MSSGGEETVAIPVAVRRAVDQRDAFFCRLCGKYLGERRAIHHILFGGDRQGMGGRRHHDPAEMVSLCWLPGDNDCHLKAHSEKAFWQHLLLMTIQSPTRVTALQLARQLGRARHQNREKRAR